MSSSMLSSPSDAVEVDAWSSSGCTVCRTILSISMMSIHWLNSFFSSASRCWVAIFSLASRSISCSYSFSFLFKVWMYRKALLRTLRFEVFLSSTLGMLRFNVSKHSFKCARLKKTQVVCQLVLAHTRNQCSRGLKLNLGLNPAKHLHMCIAVTGTTCMLKTKPSQSSRQTGYTALIPALPW